MTAAEGGTGGDCHHHIAFATCPTRACKSFIAIDVHFLRGRTLGVEAAHEINV